LQLKNWLAFHKRKSCALLEFQNIQSLSEAGINTPKAAAYGEQCNAFFEKRSFFITEKIPDAEALERKLPEYFNGDSAQENIKLRRNFITSLAGFIKKFHETNYRHRDLYLSHIFYNDNGSFYLIDLARAFRPVLLSRRFQVKDIAQLYFSAPGKYFSQTDRLRFYLQYSGRKKISKYDKFFIRKVIRKVHQMTLHAEKHGRQAPFAK
jgi:heptose I phosphotransferase